MIEEPRKKIKLHSVTCGSHQTDTEGNKVSEWDEKRKDFFLLPDIDPNDLELNGFIMPEFRQKKSTGRQMISDEDDTES